MAVCQTEARQTQLYLDIDGSLVTCRLDGSVRTWTQDGTLVKTFTGHEAPVRGLVRVGRLVVTIGTKDGRIKVWDWESERWLFDLQDPLHLIAVMTTGYGKLAVTSWSTGESAELYHIQVWDLDQVQDFASRHATRGE